MGERIVGHGETLQMPEDLDYALPDWVTHDMHNSHVLKYLQYKLMMEFGHVTLARWRVLRHHVTRAVHAYDIVAMGPKTAVNYLEMIERELLAQLQKSVSESAVMKKVYPLMTDAMEIQLTLTTVLPLNPDTRPASELLREHASQHSLEDPA